MNIATIEVSGVYAFAKSYSHIPAGLVGATVTFDFVDPRWDNLTKTAVFKGNVTRDVIMSENTVRLPPETVETPGGRLLIGVYGTDDNQRIVIPTIWADIGPIRSAADPSGDPSVDPTLPVWGQIQQQMVRSVNGKKPDENGNVQITVSGSGGNANFQVDETLKLENGILSVNTTNEMEQDNTLPITSAGVYATVGNIEALLKTI